METYIYSGKGFSESYAGKCKDGTVYSGSGFSETSIGTYKNGEIFSEQGFSRVYVGCVRNRTVYKGSGLGEKAIGSYRNNDIYYGFGLGEEYVGRYEGIDPTAAAALLLLMPEKVQTYTNPTNNNSHNSNSHNNNNSNNSNNSNNNNNNNNTSSGLSNFDMIMSYVIMAIIIALVALFGYWLFVIAGVFMLIFTLIDDFPTLRMYDKSLVSGRDIFIIALKAAGLFILCYIGGYVLCMFFDNLAVFLFRSTTGMFEPQVFIFAVLVGISLFIEELIKKGKSGNINPYFLYNVCRCKRCRAKMRIDAAKGNVLVTCPKCGGKQLFYSK